MNKTNFKPVSVVVVIILVAALLATNCAAIFVPKLYTELDMSSSGIYDISDETKELLSKIDKKVDIYIVNADGSNMKLERFLKTYASQSDMLSLKYDETEEHSPYTLRLECGDHSELLDSSYLFYYENQNFGRLSVDDYEYLLESYSANQAYAEYLNNLVYESTFYFQGDYMLSYLIEYLVFGKIPYIVSGHGENDAQNGNFAGILATVGYRFKSFDITSEKAIPEDISCFVINEPDEDYSEDEAKLVLDYLKDGGKLILVTSEKNLEMPNLMSIADYYGVKAEKGFVAEPIPDTEGEDDNESDAEAEEDDTSAEEVNIYEFSPQINADHDLMAIFDGYALVGLNANPIVRNESVNREALIVTELLVTSENAYVGDAEAKGKRTVGVCVEEETEKGSTKILWFTGADAFNKEEYFKSNNVAILYYGVVWMEDYSELGVIDPVIYGEGVLSVGKTAMLWCGVSMILLIPTAILGAGVIISMKRSKISKKS